MEEPWDIVFKNNKLWKKGLQLIPTFGPAGPE